MSMSQAVGASFEAVLNVLHALYRGQGLAYVRFNGTQSRHLGQGKVIQVRSWVDYVGFVAAMNGRGVCLDAKTIGNANRFYIASHKLFQLEDLADAAEYGRAIAFLLIESRPRNLAYIAWPDRRWRAGRAFSLRFDDLTPCPPYKTDEGYMPDWLSVVLAADYVEQGLWR